MTTAGTAAFRERTYTAQDGLQLYFRDYGDPSSTKTPVLCLPGVTRNSKDFAFLAGHLAPTRRIICPDYRGRGRSDYDENWQNYIPQTYIDDIRHLLIVCGIHKVYVVGTSLGGILGLVMAVAMPGMIAGIVLNDIGPEVEMKGLDSIVDYMKNDTSFDEWEDVADYLRKVFPDLPARSAGDWLEIAHNTYRETGTGKIVRDWDHDIVKPFEKSLTGKVSLWPYFKALNRVPVLTVRGAKSGVLSEKTLSKMSEVMPGMSHVTVDDCGHPPGLCEPNVLEAIDGQLADL